MREHLYKAKRVNWRELPKEEWWVEGSLFEGKENSYIFTNVKVTDKWENSEIGADVIGYLIDPETVCEYTGLNDKNGRKIFECDIIRKMANVYKLGENAPCGERILIGSVIWDNSSLLYPGNWSLKSKDEQGNDATYTFDNEYEVIDNIFDNPELLQNNQ